MKEKNGNSFIEKHSEIWKFIKFSFAGVSSFIVQYIVDLLFHFVIFKGLAGQTIDNPVFKFLGIDSQMDAAYAYLIAAAVGYLVSFIMNRKVTFDADSGLTSSVIMYIIMVVATIFIAAWMKGFFTDYAVTHFAWAVNDDGSVTKVADGIIFLLVTTIPFFWTYPLQRFVIHRKSGKKDAVEEASETTEAVETVSETEE
jgi:putative flippase GtrA